MIQMFAVKPEPKPAHEAEPDVKKVEHDHEEQSENLDSWIVCS